MKSFKNFRKIWENKRIDKIKERDTFEEISSREKIELLQKGVKVNFIEENVAEKTSRNRGKSGGKKTHHDWWSGGWNKKTGKTRRGRESVLNLRLPAATNKTLLKRKSSNESIAASNTKATKRVEHLINRNSTEGDSQTIFEGTPSRRTWPSNFCSRPAFLPSPPFPGQPRSYIVKYSPFIITFIYPIITNDTLALSTTRAIFFTFAYLW